MNGGYYMDGPIGRALAGTMVAAYPVYKLVTNLHEIVHRYFWWLVGWVLGGGALSVVIIWAGVRYLYKHHTPLHLHPEAAKWQAEQQPGTQPELGSLRERILRAEQPEKAGVS